uniref:Peptidylglycine monooxygenase n=1 Tax=Setaria digitata TaxID=48799 RepID=A0A915Q3W7_9BILA
MVEVERIIFVLILLSVSLFVLTYSLFTSDNMQQVRKLTMQINGYKPAIDDDYVAVSVAVKPGYIVRFEPFADADRVHHILLYGCTRPAWSKPFWRGMTTCWGFNSHILYAWARNAPDFRLPENVAFSIGHDSDPVKYLIMQVHYAHPFVGKISDYSGITVHMIDERPRNLAAVILFVSGASIQPGFSHFQTNVSCLYSSDTPIHPFAFRTHTHNMGRIVSAFYKHSDKWTMIGKRNPQWPQLFQPIEANLTISNGDLMAATCVYDSSMQKSVVHMGSTGKDEMCNFYMMFYWDSTLPDPFPTERFCSSQDKRELVNNEYPAEGTIPLPPHPELEREAFQKGFFGIVEGTVTTSIDGIKLGQVVALSFDSFGNLVIFHRGSRTWNFMSFDFQNNLRDQRPIAEDVILITYASEPNGTLSLLDKYGHKKFYMPHGLAIDQQNDYYTTDVGSHQVIKWTLSQGFIRSLSEVFALGEKFVPGNDKKHFCKPAGVAVTMDGSIFVADGYCNNRIVKFDRNGKFVTQWGQSSYDNDNIGGKQGLPLGIFSLPHDIVSNNDGSLLYVSDRENARIQIFRSDGQPVGQIVNPANGAAFGNIYSADYYKNVLYFIPGKSQNDAPLRLFSAHVEAAQVQYSFEPTKYFFNRPHSIRVSRNGQYIYVGELGENGGRVLQFVMHPNWNQVTDSLLPHSNFAANGTSQFSISSMLLITFIPVLLLISFAYRQSKKIRLGKQQSVLDRAGFKPLRTDDPETSDDDSDDIIGSQQKSNHRF